MTEGSTLDTTTVMRRIPHRFPFLLIDRVLHWEQGKNLTALKNVTINEPFFQGHFPARPVMPGVLVIEALAQAAGLLAFLTEGVYPEDNSRFFFAGIDEARFRRPVEPGDQLTLHVTLDRTIKSIWKFSAEARVGEVEAVSCKLMIATEKPPVVGKVQ
jgi:3-hydroxyacyl-[acyl-carrier-protein] dehydratase